MSGTGWSSRHSPSGAMSTIRVDPLRARRGDLGGDHAAERVADERHRRQAEHVEQLVVVEDEVPQVLDVVEAL